MSTVTTRRRLDTAGLIAAEPGKQADIALGRPQRPLSVTSPSTPPASTSPAKNDQGPNPLATGSVLADVSRHHIRGPGWIRTNVGISRRVYSPLPLAARALTLRTVDLSGLAGHRTSLGGNVMHVVWAEGSFGVDGPSSERATSTGIRIVSPPLLRLRREGEPSARRNLDFHNLLRGSRSPQSRGTRVAQRSSRPLRHAEDERAGIGMRANRRRTLVAATSQA